MNEKNTNTNFQKLIAEEFGLDFVQLSDCYVKKMLWHKMLFNEVDTMGIAQRICKDVANILFTQPIKIRIMKSLPEVGLDGKPTGRMTAVENEPLGTIIKQEVFGRMRFQEQMGVHISHFMGLGDGLFIPYRDPIDMSPAINYIPSYNVIPLTFNNHQVFELVWFTIEKLENKTFIICVIEKIKSREVRLYESVAENMTLIDWGSPLWAKIMGNVTPIQEFEEENRFSRIAWFSSGLFNPKWIDTPFHNSLIWPIWLIKNIENDYKILAEEYKNSKKRIFIGSELVKNNVNMNVNGQVQRVKQFDHTSSLFEVLDLSQEQYKEWNPQVRFNEFKAKLVLDWAILGQTIGFGSDWYSLDNLKTEMTATQVLLQHRDAYNTINNIKYSFIACVRILIANFINMWIEDGLITTDNIIQTLDDIVVEVDDGVFINKNIKVREGLDLLNAAAIDMFTFRTQYAGYSESEARAIENRVQQDQMKMMQMQMLMNPPQKEEENKKEKK